MSRAEAPIKLGSKTIGSLVKMYAVPGIIAQTAVSLYNIVDSVYIGHIEGVGSYAISGLAVTFPLMNLSIALGTLVGVGAMTIISILLGQKDYEKANAVLANTLSLNLIIGVLFSIVALIWLDPILYFFGASEKTLPYARDYMQIILAGNALTHLYHGFNGIIRSSGHPKFVMRLTLFSVIFNAIMDPVFIFSLNMGIKGAALATVICQTLALAATMWFLFQKKNPLHFTRPLFQLNADISKKSLAIGMGPFLMNTAACLVSLFVNQQLKNYGGDLSIGAFGIVNRFTMLFVMVCFGFNQGLQAIAGYNFGARKYRRVKEVYILCAKWEVLVTTLCFLCSMLLPELVVKCFTNDAELINLGIKALRIANCGFALVGFGMTTGNFFQCLGMVRKSIFLSLSRQLLFLLPGLYLLPFWMGENGVWFSIPISDMLNVIVSAILAVPLLRKLSRMADGDDPSVLGGMMS